MGTRSIAFTASGTFNVPADIKSAWITMIGGGGAGGGCNPRPGFGGGGGGSGEYVVMMPVKVTPGGTVAVTIGGGGVATNNIGGNGGDTIFGLIIAKGGIGGQNSGTSGIQASGDGGGAGGAHVASAPLTGVIGTLSPKWYMGGGCGGWPAQGDADVNGYAGAPAINGMAGGARGSGQGGGGGGASSPFGVGGAGADWVSSTVKPGHPAAATAYGAGGGGAAAVNLVTLKANGGNGAGGYCLIQWID